MPLTPQDLDQIARLIKACQQGYLPPYLLAEQLQWKQSVVNTGAGGVVQLVGANANRVWLLLASQGTFAINTDPPLSTIQGWGQASGGIIEMSVHRQGVAPQLAWDAINTAAGFDIVVYEQIWSPMTGLGVV